MCEGCVNPAVACTWLGAFLINSSFIGLISFASANHWIAGLVLAIAYTALLFIAAKQLTNRKGVPAFVVDICLLLGVIGIGASGSIAAYNLFGCGSPRSMDGSSVDTSWSFPTAKANGAADVIAWASQSRWSYYGDTKSSFVYEPVSSDLFFSGANTSNDGQTLWRAPAGGPPVMVSPALSWPSDLVLIAQHVCFVAGSPSRVHCYAPGGAVATVSVSDDAAVDSSYSPSSLLSASDGKLYFKANAPFGSTYTNAGVVYRADPPFVTSATLLSEPSSTSFPPPPPPADPNTTPTVTEGCDSEAGFRIMAIGLLFLATLPALVTAVSLWIRLKAPSMSLATFCGVSALAINYYAIVQPTGDGFPDFIKWWFFGSGAAYLIAFISLRLQNRLEGPNGLNTFRWAIDVGCLAYVTSMHAIVQVPFNDEVWRWILYQFTFLLPMVLIALVAASTSTGLPLVLASAAVFIDAYKLAAEITKLISDTTLQTLVMFAILGVVGLGVVAAGLAYNFNKKDIVDAVDKLAERACGPCRKKAKPKQVEGPSEGVAEQL